MSLASFTADLLICSEPKDSIAAAEAARSASSCLTVLGVGGRKTGTTGGRGGGAGVGGGGFVAALAPAVEGPCTCRRVSWKKLSPLAAAGASAATARRVPVLAGWGDRQ